jgi:hypothetical protein
MVCLPARVWAIAALAAGLLLGVSALPSAAQGPDRGPDQGPAWGPAPGSEEIATYFNKRFGFTLSYPTAQFKPQEPLSEEGRVWVSHDGSARVLAGALANADGLSLADYREFLLKESYAGARPCGKRGANFAIERTPAKT